MPYAIQLVESAVKDLNALDARDRSTVKAGIETHLRHQPTQESRSRIKRLRGTSSPQYRLRIDEYRVFYDVDETTVTVLAVVAKSQAEQWLNNNAERGDDSSAAD